MHISEDGAFWMIVFLSILVALGFLALWVGSIVLGLLLVGFEKSVAWFKKLRGTNGNQ